MRVEVAGLAKLQQHMVFLFFLWQLNIIIVKKFAQTRGMLGDYVEI
ncbi:hypothetical protein Psfp_02769 [Pelotomaculum sp. FP]|nr:hypothetical protein [Pelotomaculum sp. FP]TEB14626.1 hypothetical protein Psfp_02769 [Pelotomaculum sp. FP]